MGIPFLTQEKLYGRIGLCPSDQREILSPPVFDAKGTYRLRVGDPDSDQ